MSNVISIRNFIAKVCLEKLDIKELGHTTGFHSLDKKIGGLVPELIIVGSRPSLGKTSFVMDIAACMSIKNHLPTLVFAMDVHPELLATRLLSSLARIELVRLRNNDIRDEEWPKIFSATSCLYDSKLFIDDADKIDVTEIVNKSHALANTHGQLGLVVIDFLQLVSFREHGHNRKFEISQICSTLKKLSEDLRVPIICTSHLSRDIELRTDKRPVLSDLDYCASIETEADKILFIYRDDIYNNEQTGVAEIIIAKNSGALGKIQLMHLPEFVCFENLPIEE